MAHERRKITTRLTKHGIACNQESGRSQALAVNNPMPPINSLLVLRRAAEMIFAHP
jgi:hypothetical protein